MFGMFLNCDEVGRLAPIGAVSFLWGRAEQKDIADSRTGVGCFHKAHRFRF